MKLRRKSIENGVDIVQYCLYLFQAGDFTVKKFVPFIGKLETGQGKDFNFTGYEFDSNDIDPLQ
eukprot:UN22510